MTELEIHEGGGWSRFNTDPLKPCRCEAIIQRWFGALWFAALVSFYAGKLVEKEQMDLTLWNVVKGNSAMRVIVCECQAGVERQMYLIWFTQTLGVGWRGGGGWGASWVSWQALNLESLLLFRYAYSPTVAKFAKVSRIWAVGDESRRKRNGNQERTEPMCDCSKVIKCTSHDQY